MVFFLTVHMAGVSYTHKTPVEGKMRTNIDIDDALLEEAFSVSAVRTKKELIHEALKEFIRLKKRKDLTELAGLVQFSNDFDHKKVRETRG
jgi:Arc/MetJ family transcription regulator